MVNIIKANIQTHIFLWQSLFPGSNLSQILELIHTSYKRHLNISVGILANGSKITLNYLNHKIPSEIHITPTLPENLYHPRHQVQNGAQ